MSIDTAIILAAIVLVLLWPVHQQLELRQLRFTLRRQHTSLRQQRRAIIQLQTIVTGLPTSSYQPMPTVTKVTATISGDRSLQPHTPNDRQRYAQGGPVKGRRPLWGKEDGPELIVPMQAGLHSAPRNASPAPETCIADVDQTLRLARPPARSDIEHLIAKAGRCLTATELAAQLERRPWDLLPDIEQLLKGGRIQTVPGHTAGRTAYRLADATPHVVAR